MICDRDAAFEGREGFSLAQTRSVEGRDSQFCIRMRRQPFCLSFASRMFVAPAFIASDADRQAYGIARQDFSPKAKRAFPGKVSSVSGPQSP